MVPKGRIERPSDAYKATVIAIILQRQSLSGFSVALTPFKVLIMVPTRIELVLTRNGRATTTPQDHTGCGGGI